MTSSFLDFAFNRQLFDCTSHLPRGADLMDRVKRSLWLLFYDLFCWIISQAYKFPPRDVRQS